VTALCWKCQEPTQGPVCVSCGTIQPPSPDTDPFVLLGLKRSYRIDPAELEQRFRDVSRVVHPDRFVKASAVERRMSLQWTAAVNAARRLLKDPMQRAHWLATGRPLVDEIGQKVDNEFLEEMFELNERAEEAPDQVRAEATEKRAEVIRILDATFDAQEKGDGTLDRVEELLAQIRYLDGIVTRP
jgi:molecular chaperone HscB